jgi:signal transduction histidine kinase
MPPAATPRPLLRPYALAVSAGLSLALSAGLLLPTLLGCLLAHADDVCHQRPALSLHNLLGTAAALWIIWLGAAFSHDWLPSAPEARRRGLALQIAGLALATLVLMRVGMRFGGLSVGFSPYDLQVQATFSACACLALEYHQRGRRREADAASLRRGEQEQARQLDAARAALLQAQVEPHFLFNTLAHLRRLAHTDATAARAMLADLRRYLAAALPELRQAETTLARELELVRAFLALHQRRIGPERLQLVFDIAPGLADVVLPSTCLLTLAENAIKHGIGPQVEGGAICVRAVPDPELPHTLRLEVADTGAGMVATSGGGTGLVTLRARLAGLYGSAAHLSLHLNQPCGLIARVQLPWR